MTFAAQPWQMAFFFTFSKTTSTGPGGGSRTAWKSGCFRRSTPPFPAQRSLSAFISGEGRRVLILGFAVSYFVLFWSMHPAPGQSFYWFTGSVEYQLNLSLTLLLLALLLHRPKATGSWQRVLQSALAPAIGFLVAGIHELVGSMLAVTLLVGAVVTRKIGHPNRRLWAWAAVFSLLGLLLVAFAPGNQARRISNFPDGYNLPLTLWLTLWQAIKAVTVWICDVKLLLATLLFILHPAIRSIRTDWRLPGRMSIKWLILGIWVLLLAIGFGAPSWITGQEMAGRTLSTVYYVFLLGWFVTVFVFTRGLDFRSIIAKEYLLLFRSLTLVLYSLSVATTGNARVAIHDLVHRAIPWREAIEERYDTVRGAEGKGVAEVFLPTLPDRPRIFGRELGDITRDPTHWSNACFANFFGLRSVRLALPTETRNP